jgi:hypothetical protein
MLCIPKQPTISRKGIPLPAHSDGARKRGRPVVDDQDNGKAHGSRIAAGC